MRWRIEVFPTFFPHWSSNSWLILKKLLYLYFRMIMKNVYLKSSLLLGAIGMAVVVKAQQDPYYTHFKFVKQSFNPASVGEKDNLICLNGVWHSQWRNYNDETHFDRRTGEAPPAQETPTNVAPTTYAFNISGQITANGGDRKLGAVGISVYDDELGFMKSTTAKLQAAIFIPVQGNFGRLAIGPELGFYQFGIVNPKWVYRDPNDPRIPAIGTNDAKFDVGFGAFYKQQGLGPIQDFYAGLSISHLTAPTYSLSTPVINFNQERHWYILSGGRLPLNNPSLELEPAVLIKYRTKFQVDLNTTILWNETARAGLGYRQWGNIDAVSIMLGYIWKNITVGYSYDITLSSVRTVSDGTHEFMIAYCFGLPSIQPPTPIYLRGTRHL